jgi:predicted small integral membrane protein
MKNLVNILFVSTIAIIMVGCTTTESVKEAKGQGTIRVYAHSFDTVFQATLDAAPKHKLSVVEKNRNAKTIMLSHGTTWMSWGENIAVFFKELAANSTEVEVVMKPVMQPLNFPKDWEKILHEQIASELKNK